jgi:hypothetical protein
MINTYAKDREEKNADGSVKDVSVKSELTHEQKDKIKNQVNKVYAALADTLKTADQMRILLNKFEVPEGHAHRLWKAIKERFDIRLSDATKERLWETFNGMKMDRNDDFTSYKAKVDEAVANL